MNLKVSPEGEGFTPIVETIKEIYERAEEDWEAEMDAFDEEQFASLEEENEVVE